MNPSQPKRPGTRTTHGLSKTPVYSIWRSMLNRCNWTRHNEFHRYGGRGIKVCDRWMKFENFLADMGMPAAGESIERRENDKDYCKENCRWATDTEQARNRRTNRLLTLNGETRCVAEWAELTGISQYTINTRLGRGWSDERALTTPPGNNHGRFKADQSSAHAGPEA